MSDDVVPPKPKRGRPPKSKSIGAWPDLLAKVTTPIIDYWMAKRFSVARYRLKLTQAEIAEKLGLKQEVISRLETGKLKHLPINLEKIREVYGVHTQFILLESNVWNYLEYVRYKEHIQRTASV